MNKKCNHPIEKLDTFKHSWTDYHTFGEDRVTDCYLRCTKCKNKVRIVNMYNVGVNEYKKLTGRTIDLEEMKKIFKSNNCLFRNIEGFNPDLKRITIHNPQIEAEINKEQKLIKKYKNLIDKHENHLIHLEKLLESGKKLIKLDLL